MKWISDVASHRQYRTSTGYLLQSFFKGELIQFSDLRSVLVASILLCDTQVAESTITIYWLTTGRCLQHTPSAIAKIEKQEHISQIYLHKLSTISILYFYSKLFKYQTYQSLAFAETTWQALQSAFFSMHSPAVAYSK